MTRDTAIGDTEKNKIKRIANRATAGDFDFSKQSIAFFVTWTGVAGYLAYESAQMYLTLGADGTKYLPPSSYFEDKTELGQYSAAICNFSLNWYFLVKTILDIRKAYLNYQVRKKIEAPMTRGEIVGAAIKVIFSLAMATTTGIIFAQIAAKDSKQPGYNQAITGGVNILLNFLGSMALINYGGLLLGKIQSYYCPTNKDNNSEATLDILSENYDQLVDQNNANFRSASLCQVTEKLTALTESSSLLVRDTAASQNISPAEKILKGVFGTVWLGMQYCNGISLVGYLFDTVVNMAELFKIEEAVPSWFVGCVFFATFAGLAIKLVHETIDETSDLLESAKKKFVNLKNNPSLIGERDTIISGVINTLFSLPAITSYFFSYVSSNSSLDLNAKYDFKQMWNIIPTCIGTTTFNGFAFLMIFIAASALAKKYVVYDSEKRNCVDRAHKVLSFLKSDPTILSRMPANKVALLSRDSYPTVW